MTRYTRVLTASILLALTLGLTAQAKAEPTRMTTDPNITKQAVAEQMNQVTKEKDVNFNNMLLQQNLGSAIADAAAPEASNLDINLKGAVTTAIQNNRDITIADLQRKEAEAAVSEAAAAKNPSTAYSWNWTRQPGQSGTPITNRYSNGIDVTFPVWTGGSLEGALDAARYTKNIYDLEYYRTEADTKLNAVSAYYQYLDAIKLAEVQAQSVQDYSEHLTNVQQQFDAGIVAKLDVLTSSTSLANAKQSKIAADNARDVAEAHLNNIMRIPMNTKLNPLDKDFPEPAFDITMDQAILMAQKYRWELVEADYRVKVAQANLKTAKAGYMPQVKLSGGYGWNEAALSKVDHDDWHVGATVSLPVWDGGTTQARVKSAKAALKMAQEQLLQARESVEYDVRQDYLNILAYKEQIRATEAAVAQAEEAYKIATVRYSSGVGINLDVLDAEVQLNRARTDYIKALYNYNIGLATLEHAMGIPAIIHPEFAKQTGVEAAK